MHCDTFHDLIWEYYSVQLHGKSGQKRALRLAKQWILTRTTTPTRKEILARMQQKCPGGDKTPGATQANKEVAFMRAAFRWGIYHERWDGGDPTVGIRLWKTPKRKRRGHEEELRALLQYFHAAKSPTELRDRALFGIALVTGCRPSEARMITGAELTSYRTMGRWTNGKTKNGDPHELPIPWQVMAWIEAWRQIPHERPSPYLFPGQKCVDHDVRLVQPMTDDAVRMRWSVICKQLEITGLWNYDLRRTMAMVLGNDLGYSDKVIDAVLNHDDGRALGHYYHVSFDALTKVVQHYADWLWGLKGSDHAIPLTR